MKRITWDETRYGTRHGTIHRRPLFTISRTTRRDDPAPWKLVTTLPFRLALRDFNTTDDAEAFAERVLTAFVGAIGAQWPVEESK
jgi:hypothetical protein